MSSATFDAEFVVVGSGPAGVSASIPLVEAGRRVLMIDGAAHSQGSESAGDDDARWRRMLGDRLDALRPDDGLSPKLRTPTARIIVDGFRNWANIGEDDFFAIGAMARGGLSRIWGGLVAEFDDVDIRSWPIRLDDLTPSYYAVSARIGLSGSVDDDMAGFYGRSGPVLSAPPLGPTANVVLKNYQRRPRPSDFALGLARNALLTADRGERRACDHSLDCLWGCRRGAIYDARQDLVLLQKSPHFQLLDGAKVKRLSPISQGWSLAIIGREQPLRAHRILLAAGAIGTLRLVIPQLGSAQTNFQLVSSPVLAIPMIVPRRIGGVAPRTGYTLAQLGFTHAYSSTPGDYATGALYEISALPPSSFVARLPFGRRAGTEIFRALAPTLVVTSVYFPGAYSANLVHTELNGDDIGITIRGGVAGEFDRLTHTVRRRLARIWSRLGAYALPGATLATPGTDAHLGGVFPMGANDRHGTNAFGELNAGPALHVVDGSALPTIPSKPTTLTIMANADRIARHLVQSAR